MQRVTQAAVTVAGEQVGAIGTGLCVLVGVTHSDTEATARKLADKVFTLRVLDDEAGVMNRSLADRAAVGRVGSLPPDPSMPNHWWRPSWLACASRAPRWQPAGSAPRCW